MYVQYRRDDKVWPETLQGTLLELFFGAVGGLVAYVLAMVVSLPVDLVAPLLYLAGAGLGYAFPDAIENILVKHVPEP
jgi:hypothetical protein